MSYVLLKGIMLVMSTRATTREEGLGLDASQHGEEAYTTGDGAILILPEASPSIGITLPVAPGHEVAP